MPTLSWFVHQEREKKARKKTKRRKQRKGKKGTKITGPFHIKSGYPGRILGLAARDTSGIE
jgi:hypothetical protein